MTVNNTAKARGRGGRNAQKQVPPNATNVEPVENTTIEAKAMSVEKNVKPEMSEAPKEESPAADNVVKITARPVQNDPKHQQGSIQLHQPTSMVWNRPVMPSDFEVKDTMTIAGVRPIAANGIQVFDTFLNGRPIASSSLQVFEMLPGNRPIFVSDFKMVQGSILPGDRPIMVSDPQLMEASMLPGNRPIAPNDIVDPEPATLMGYLD
jgi:hypothetical protein